MWTTWNSRASCQQGLTVVCALLIGCTSGAVKTSASAPDSPRPARAPSVTAVTEIMTGSPAQTVELKGVNLRRVRGDTTLMRMAGSELLRRSSDPIAVEVTTAAPLD